MKVLDLMYILGEFHEESEVYIATQPSWPLQFEVRAVRSNEDQLPDPDRPDAVYLLTGEHPASGPYAPRDIF